MIDSTEVARLVEAHEADGWRACVDATASTPGNPLRAAAVNFGDLHLTTLSALNFDAFNKVIGLGVNQLASDETLTTVEAFYSHHNQSRFLVEVTPAMRPTSLRDELEKRGFRPKPERVIKLWQEVASIPQRTADVEVITLTPSDRDAYVQVSLSAWGLPKFFAPWFGATIGHDDFRHFGVVDDGKLVSTVAMYVKRDLAWTAFGVTDPAYEGRGYQKARIIRLLEEARSLGCRIIHNETAQGTHGAPNVSLLNLQKFGFNKLYEKELYLAPSSAR